MAEKIAAYVTGVGPEFYRDRNRDGEADHVQTYQVADVAKILGVAPSTVYDLARQRKIAHCRIGTGRGRIVFTEEDIEEFLVSCKVEALSMPASFRFTHAK